MTRTVWAVLALTLFSPGSVKGQEVTLEKLLDEITVLRSAVTELAERVTLLESELAMLKESQNERARTDLGAPTVAHRQAEGPPGFHQPASWDQLKEDMSSQQVISILGEPAFIRGDPYLLGTLFWEGEVPGPGYISGNVDFGNNRAMTIRKPVFSNDPAPSARVIPPSPRGMIMPPANSALRGITVEVWVFVDATGRVVPDSTRLNPPTSNEEFNRQLIREAAEWPFNPAKENGRPVPSWFPYTISGEEGLNVQLEGLRRDFPEYYGNIQRQIQQCFEYRGRGRLETSIVFVINRDGTVDAETIEFDQRSGNVNFDYAAMGAMECAGDGRFGPLPEELGWDRLPILFTFTPRGSEVVHSSLGASPGNPVHVQAHWRAVHFC